MAILTNSNGEVYLDSSGNALEASASSPTLQNKSVTYTSNGTNTVTADTGYDGLGSVQVTTNVNGGSSVIPTITVSAGQVRPGGSDYFYVDLTQEQQSIITNSEIGYVKFDATALDYGVFYLTKTYTDESTLELNSVEADSCMLVAAFYYDDDEEYTYGYLGVNLLRYIVEKNLDETISSSSTNAPTSSAVVDYVTGLYNPDTKTSAMTQAVGKDANGKLWTTPGSGGGGGSTEIPTLTFTKSQVVVEDEDEPSYELPLTITPTAEQASILANRSIPCFHVDIRDINEFFVFDMIRGVTFSDEEQDGIQFSALLAENGFFGLEIYYTQNGDDIVFEISEPIGLLSTDEVENMIVTEIDNAPSDSEIPTAKAVYDAIQAGGGSSASIPTIAIASSQFDSDGSFTPTSEQRAIIRNNNYKLVEISLGDNAEKYIYTKTGDADNWSYTLYSFIAESGNLSKGYICKIYENGSLAEYSCIVSKIKVVDATSKTDAMTQSVGIDSDGKLWTADWSTALNGKVSTSDYNPNAKTDAMTQAVGKDSNGKLWTAPGGSVPYLYFDTGSYQNQVVTFTLTEEQIAILSSENYMTIKLHVNDYVDYFDPHNNYYINRTIYTDEDDQHWCFDWSYDGYFIYVVGSTELKFYDPDQ